MKNVAFNMNTERFELTDTRKNINEMKLQLSWLKDEKAWYESGGYSTTSITNEIKGLESEIAEAESM